MQCCKLLFKYKRKINTILGYNLLNRLKFSHLSNQFKLNVLFFGTDNFSLESLILLDNARKCVRSKIKRMDVITSFKAKGNPIRSYAKRNNIDCYDWISFQTDGAKHSYDLGIVVSFGHLIPEHIIKMFPFGMINVHASLLPRWRGASPIIYAILNEDSTTGVSIMKIHPHKFDVGEILAQKEIAVPEKVLMPDLHKTLANEGAQLLLDCIENVPDSLHNAEQQSDLNITYAPRVTESMAHINWNTMPSRYICNLYRALYSFKWLTTHWHKVRVKLKEIDLTHDSPNATTSNPLPGAVEYDKQNKCLRVYCCDGHTICVTKLSLEGRKAEMSAADFNNGFLKKVNHTQRYFT